MSDYEWDEEKSERNRAERGFGFEVVLLIDLMALPRRQDVRREYPETRWQSVAIIGGKPYMIIWAAREAVVRAISVRRMHQEEYDAFVEPDG